MLSPQSLTLSASTYFTSGYTNTDSLHKIILSIFSISWINFFQVISRQMYFFVFWNLKRCFFLSYLGPPSLANSPVYKGDLHGNCYSSWMMKNSFTWKIWWMFFFGASITCKFICLTQGISMAKKLLNSSWMMRNSFSFSF